MTSSARKTARRVESNTAMEAAARAGFVANGIVHALVGTIAIALAFGARGESDQTGALTAIARAPFGIVLLWVLALGLWGLAIWYAAEGILVHDRPGAKGTAAKWGRRAAEWGKALLYLLLGVLTASIALGARPSGEQTAEGASGGVLALPGGPFLLAAIGVAIGAGGIGFAVIGIRQRFLRTLAPPPGKAGTAVKAVGVFGFVAKGVALTIVGVLLVIAAVRLDPETAGGLDGAIKALFDLALGPALVVAVGLGLIAYGVFCGLRARYERF